MKINPARVIDLKSLIWIVMITLQSIGGVHLQNTIVDIVSDREMLDRYSSLVFEFNVIFAAIFIFNYLLRRYFVVSDTYYYHIGKLNIKIQIQLAVDLICLFVSVIYLIVGINLVFGFS